VIFVLDTNVLSERTKLRPDGQVEKFLRAVPAENIRVSSIVLAEIVQGVENNPTPDLQLFLAEVLTLPVADFGEAEALAWGRMTSAGIKRGLKMELRDTMIAATAAARGWTVVTRNISDFVPLGVNVFNPWTDQLE
jgi:predicted nucleic acid-binding protein